MGKRRRTRGDTASHTQTNMVEAGLIGSQIIRDYLRGQDTKHRKVKPISNTKLQAAIKAVEHTIGLPKAKIELKTDALTMKDIAEIAASFDEKVIKTAQNFEENSAESAQKLSESEDILHVPTKPLTKRQIKERAQN